MNFPACGKAQQKRDGTAARRPSQAHLDQLVEQATVDAYGDSEQRCGLFTMMEDHLALPFETEVLGVPVTVERLDLTAADEVIAICRRGRTRQRIGILDLPLPSPPPQGPSGSRRTGIGQKDV